MKKVQFHRVAVGNHLMLGGDNLDLALAHFLEGKLGKKLPPRQWNILVRIARQVKENLLGENPPETWTVTLPGGSSKLIGGGISVEVTRKEVETLLVEGFFPETKLSEKPAVRRSGFQEFGLPYAPDSGITRYLADFLSTHRFAGEDSGTVAGNGAQRSDRIVPPNDSPLLSGHCASATFPAAVSQGNFDPARPDVVLYNGGLFESPTLRRRLTETLSGWFSTPEKPWEPKILENDRLDLAVSRGATYYGLVRRGIGVRIAAGLARTYYVGIHPGETVSVDTDDSAVQTLCLIPARAVPGEDVVMENRTFRLKVGSPVEFPLYVSSVRLTDTPGEIVPYDPRQMTVLPPIRTILKKRRAAGKSQDTEDVRIQLHCRLTEIGTLELWCDEVLPETEKGKRPGRWQLEFDVRSATRTEVSAHESQAEAEGVVDEEAWEGCQRILEEVFSTKKNGSRDWSERSERNDRIAAAGDSPLPSGLPEMESGSAVPSGRSAPVPATIKPAKIMDALKDVTQLSRNRMPASLLRRIWAKLMELEKGRELSAEHEVRWLNLLGFSLRPGFGYGMDDWRVAETWKRLQGKMMFPGVAVRMQWWILWRRIAGGLSAGQQVSLAQPLIGPLKTVHHQLVTGRGKADFPFQGQEVDEIFRLLGSLERLPVEMKETLGEILLEFYGRKRFEPNREVIVWALGRLGARMPMYGKLDTVLPTAVAETWCGKMRTLFSETAKKSARGVSPGEFLAIMLLSRRTEDRYRDISEDARAKILSWLRDFAAPEHILELVRQKGTLSEAERSEIFGEALPPALKLEEDIVS